MREMFSETIYAWRRLRLLWAESLVLGVINHGPPFVGYIGAVLDAADEIKALREKYYPDPRHPETGRECR